jgi:hypothetical protein
VQFVRVLLIADGLAVHHVEVHDANVADRRGEDATLRIVQAVDVGDDVDGFLAREDGDAVIGLLSGVHGAVAHGRDFVDGKFLVDDLRFLQGEDVRLRLRKPLLEVGQPDLEGVDVP